MDKMVIGLCAIVLFAMAGCTTVPASKESSPGYFSEIEMTDETRTMKQFLLTARAVDGFILEGKLRLPSSGTAKGLVFFVNGSGPNTYDDMRQFGDDKFNYHDLFAQQFTDRCIAYFSYSTRGVSPGDEPPLFSEVDEEGYKTYLPRTSASDIAVWTELFSHDVRLGKGGIVLLGWSEGAIIAPYAVLEEKAPVAALVLAGVPIDTMADILDWQLGGEPSMRFYRQYFDTDGDGVVSSGEFAADSYQIVAALGSPVFSFLDIDGDGVLKAGDFQQMLAPYRQQILDAVERDDDAWLKENYSVRLTSGWFKEHGVARSKAEAPIIPSNWEMLPRLDIPVFIFHGEDDSNVPASRVRDMEEYLNEQGKKNVHVRIFPDHDHDLNYLLYPARGILSEGITALVDAAAAVFGK